MQKKQCKVKIMQGNRFQPVQEIYLDFRSSSSHLPNRMFYEQLSCIFHWKIMKMGDSSHLFSRKVGLTPKKQSSTKFYRFQAKPECYPLFENNLSRYLSYWKDERDKSPDYFQNQFN